MTLKTFNIDENIYKAYSKHSKKNGISMSKQVENFLRSEIDKIANKDSKSEKVEIDSGKIGKEIKSFDNSLEHPLGKYC